GELCFSGPTLMIGYYGKQEETDDIIKIHSEMNYLRNMRLVCRFQILVQRFLIPIIWKVHSCLQILDWADAIQ
ncbi:MAG: hypothetical protein U0L08_03110, partial [Bacteroidales bacterium]|nr:hypothetical protein [Bacteroidales bacterium]